MFGGDPVANLAVTVSCDETSVTVEADGDLYPDLLDDALRRASSTLIATMIQLVALVDDDT